MAVGLEVGGMVGLFVGVILALETVDPLGIRVEGTRVDGRKVGFKEVGLRVLTAEGFLLGVEVGEAALIELVECTEGEPFARILFA